MIRPEAAAAAPHHHSSTLVSELGVGQRSRLRRLMGTKQTGRLSPACNTTTASGSNTERSNQPKDNTNMATFREPEPVPDRTRSNQDQERMTFPECVYALMDVGWLIVVLLCTLIMINALGVVFHA